MRIKVSIKKLITQVWISVPIRKLGLKDIRNINENITFPSRPIINDVKLYLQRRIT